MANTPLTAYDLRQIADALEPIELLPALADQPLLGRIEVYRPDGDGDEVVGHIVRENIADGPGMAWLGFIQGGDA